MAQIPFFHADSQSVRFWVTVGEGRVGASIARSVLQHHFRAPTPDGDVLQLYLGNAVEIDAAVRRRVASGSIEPVMLREFDLRPSAGPARP